MRLHVPDQGHPVSLRTVSASVFHPHFLSSCCGQDCVNVCAAATETAPALPLPCRSSVTCVRARFLGQSPRLAVTGSLGGSGVHFSRSLLARPRPPWLETFPASRPLRNGPEPPSRAGRWPRTLRRDHPVPQQLRVLESSRDSRSPYVSPPWSPGHRHSCPQTLTMAAVGGHFSSAQKVGSQWGSCSDGAKATGRHSWSSRRCSAGQPSRLTVGFSTVGPRVMWEVCSYDVMRFSP